MTTDYQLTEEQRRAIDRYDNDPNIKAFNKMSYCIMCEVMQYAQFKGKKIEAVNITASDIHEFNDGSLSWKFGVKLFDE